MADLEYKVVIGLEIMSPVFTEEKLLWIARMYEMKTDWNDNKPPVG